LYLGIRGTVVALDRASGAELWRTTLKGWGFVNLAQDGEFLLAATHGELFCLEAATGRIRWNNPLRGLGYGLVSIAGADNTALAAQYHADAASAATASSAAT
jgi:outer membrane protein assembly factor BamB